MSNNNLTPMMKQFFDIKKQYPEFILFFRLGDFYELFDEDAIKTSSLLGLTLTKRQEFPMCGFPHHSKNTYLQKLIQNNYQVAICEQVESAADSKTGFDRKVTEIITPGTYINQEQVDSRYILALSVEKNMLSYVLIEPSIGSIDASIEPFESDLLSTIIEKYRPSEILYPSLLPETIQESFKQIFHTSLSTDLVDLPQNTAFLKKHFKVESLTFLDLDQHQAVLNILGAGLRYIDNNFQKDIGHIVNFNFLKPSEHLYLSDSTIRHLEVIEPFYKSEIPSSLYQQLNHTKTSLGARYLKYVMVNPSAQLSLIKERHQMISFFYKNSSLLEQVRSSLSHIPDMERLFGKIVLKTATPKDVWSLYLGLFTCQEILLKLENTNVLDEASFIPHDSIEPLTAIIKQELLENPPLQFGQDPVMNQDFFQELGDLRKKAFDSYSLLLDIEKKEQERSGISKLKLKYNKILGYYFEISKGSASKMPEHFIKKQSLVNVERFTVEALIEFEAQVLDSKNQLDTKELELFTLLCRKISSFTQAVEAYSRFIKNIDMIASFAHKAIQSNYVKPIMKENGALMIEEGRHPVVEQFVEHFIPNSVELNDTNQRLAIISGPNMAGKSTFLRQTAIITLMAHIGSFVPAAKAEIPLTDKIFTRIGASDNLAKGESTFLVEMSETAQILRGVTERSLVIMDEIGRGTSTKDGLALAWAIAEYLCDPNTVRGKVLFATHYHELAAISESHFGVFNLRVAISEYEDKIIFLHKVEKGVANKSYGIHVAKLAGIPKIVTQKAEEILNGMDEPSPTVITKKGETKPNTRKDRVLSPVQKQLEKKIQSLNINETTPVQALKVLEELQTLLKPEENDGVVEHLF